MSIIEKKTIDRIKRSADKINSINDLNNTSFAQSELLQFAREIYVEKYLDKLIKKKVEVYVTREYSHPIHSNIKVTPHLVRDDGIVILFNIFDNHSDKYILKNSKNIIHLTMNVLKIKKCLLYTICLRGRKLHLKNLSEIKEREITYLPHKATDYIKTLLRKKRRVGSDETLSSSTDSVAPIKGFEVSKWIPASKTRNYALNDTLVDWLELTDKQSSNKTYEDVDVDSDPDDNMSVEVEEEMIFDHNSTSNTFDSFLMNKGIEFEKKVMKLLNETFDKSDIKTICKNNQSFHQKVLSYEKETIKAMKNGIPLIYQPVLMNREGPLSYSYGMPDLLVRSDYMDLIVTENPYDKYQSRINAPKLGNQPYHYVVVDIKYTTLELCADGKRIRNNGSFPAYKCQLYIYNHALGQAQGYEPESSYILGRKYKYHSQGQTYEGTGCFDKLGHIMYGSWDNMFVDEAIGAVKWIRKLRSDGSNWKLYPKPSVMELYPNMCAPSDPRWYNFKETYAKRIGEISLLWNCGTVNRSIGRENGIRSFRDAKCTAQRLGVKGIYKAPILDAVISINQKKKFKNVLDRIDLTLNPSVDNQWLEESDLRISVDFETISNLFDDFRSLPLSSKSNYLFLIGISYQYKSEDPVHEFFIISELSDLAEAQMLTELFDFLKKITCQYLGKNCSVPPLTHWGHIERSLFKKICEKSVSNHSLSRSLRKKIKLISHQITFDDLGEAFKRNPIVINGCFKFGLKEIAKRLNELGLIKSSWDSKNPCSNGNTAMYLAHEAYQKGTSLLKNPHIKNIISYNKIDCMVLLEIIGVLRKKILKK